MAKNVTDFSTESDLAAAVAAAKAKKVPLGGAPMPQMPRLDQAPADRHQGVQSVSAARRVLTPEEQAKLQERGQFRDGVGAAYAANQPALPNLPTDEDGNPKEIDPRLAPRPAGAGLRPETVDALQAVAAANAKHSGEQESKEKIEEDDEIYDFNEFGDRVRSLLNNKKRQTAIESRCAPMAFEDLLLNGFVMQRVPIIPKQFEPTFRSLTGDEDIAIKRLMGSVRGPDQYVLDLFSLYNLTAGLHAINGKLLPTHLDKNGDFDEKLFEEKFKVVSKMAIPILADLSTNFAWFTNRVQKLTVIDDIKGF